jgi:hypothetical protein
MPNARSTFGPQSLALGSTPAQCRGRKIVGASPRVSVRVHGMTPTLRQAIRVGGARCVALLPMSQRGLPANWAVPLARDELVIATTPIVVEAIGAMGVAALVVRQRALAAIRLDDEAPERIACALADALLAEIG